MQYHPDNKKSNAEKDLANKQMMAINNAYKILKDEESRQLYDKQRLQATATAVTGLAPRLVVIKISCSRTLHTVV